MKLDDPIQPRTCPEDALDIVYLAEAPITIGGLVARMSFRWTRPQIMMAVDSLISSGVVVWTQVVDRPDCLMTAPGFNLEQYQGSTRTTLRGAQTRDRILSLIGARPITLQRLAAAVGITERQTAKHTWALMESGLIEVASREHVRIQSERGPRTKVVSYRRVNARHTAEA